MLKVYLDLNIYQDLKKPEYHALLQKVLASKKHVIFCFSEAHLYDLNHDRTDNKFEDMRFIEGIAENHCYVFTDRTEFIDRTPQQYYNDFEWPSTFGFENIGDPFWQMLTSLFRAIPLNFKTLLQDSELPSDMPARMKNLLLQPVTMYDFCMAMLELSDNLASNQSEFKELVRYLHNNSLLGNIYEGMGIKGYDGNQVTDKNIFWKSYAERFIVKGQEKSRYSLFMDMYNGLEFMGLVKGKPKKQKMMNMVNDGRHAFFGTVCDVIVSKDSDFLEKCKFMYNIEGIGTELLPASALEQFLDQLERCSKLTLTSLFDELATPLVEEKIIDVVQKDNAGSIIYKNLNNLYYGYFNLLGHAEDEHGVYWTICRRLINYNNVPFKLQIRYIVSRLLSELNNDIHQKGEFTFDEPLANQSEIRCWAIQNMVISLVIDEILYLNIYPLQYLQNRWEKDKSLTEPIAKEE